VDHSLIATGRALGAYRLTSTRPVLAYQFNPLDDPSSASADASLLYPDHGLDTRYVVADYPALVRRPSSNDYYAYITIVGTAAGSTAVDVVPSAPIVAGVGM